MADRLDACKPDALQWADLGAESRADYLSRCRQEWDRTHAALEAHDQEAALDLCSDGIEELEALSCDGVMALYGLPD